MRAKIRLILLQRTLTNDMSLLEAAPFQRFANFPWQATLIRLVQMNPCFVSVGFGLRRIMKQDVAFNFEVTQYYY